MNRYTPRLLQVFFDEDCPLCLRLAERLLKEDTYFEVQFLPMRASASLDAYRVIEPYVAAGRFVALDDRGNLYLDTNARIMVLFATRRYRALSYTLSVPGVQGLAEAFFEGISKNRFLLSAGMHDETTDSIRQNLCNDSRCSP